MRRRLKVRHRVELATGGLRQQFADGRALARPVAVSKWWRWRRSRRYFQIAAARDEHVSGAGGSAVSLSARTIAGSCTNGPPRDFAEVAAAGEHELVDGEGGEQGEREERRQRPHGVAERLSAYTVWYRHGPRLQRPGGGAARVLALCAALWVMSKSLDARRTLAFSTVPQRDGGQHALARIIRVGLNLSAPTARVRAERRERGARLRLPPPDGAVLRAAVDRLRAGRERLERLAVLIRVARKRAEQVAGEGVDSAARPIVVPKSISLPSRENLRHENEEAPPRSGVNVTNGPFSPGGRAASARRRAPPRRRAPAGRRRRPAATRRCRRRRRRGSLSTPEQPGAPQVPHARRAVDRRRRERVVLRRHLERRHAVGVLLSTQVAVVVHREVAHRVVDVARDETSSELASCVKRTRSAPNLRQSVTFCSAPCVQYTHSRSSSPRREELAVLRESTT